MIDSDKYEGHTEGKWKLHYDDSAVDGDYLDYGAQLDPVGALHPMLIADAQLIADAPLLLAEVKRLTEFRDKVLAAFIEMPRNSRSLTYLLNDEGYLKHYTLEDYRKGLHPYSLGLYELHEEWKEKAQQYLGEEEE